MIYWDVDLSSNQTNVICKFDKNQYEGFYKNSPLISVLEKCQSNIELKFSVVNILFEVYRQFNYNDRNKKSLYQCSSFALDVNQITKIVDSIELPDRDLILLDLSYESSSSYFGTAIAKKIIKKYKKSKNVKLITCNSNRSEVNNFYYCDNFFEYYCYDRFIKKNPLDHRISNKLKKFLSFNRRPDTFKLEFIKELYKNNIVDSMHISHPAFDSYQEKKLDLDFQNYNPILLLSNGLTRHNIDHGLRVLDQFTSFNEKYFEESYWNIVLEGIIEHQLNTILITEKMFKPIYLKCPFVVFGQPFYLKELHKMGYKSFGDFIDESYDEEKNDIKRLKKIISLIKDLNDLDEKSFQKMYYDLQSILEFNYNKFLERGKSNIIGQNLITYLKETR